MVPEGGAGRCAGAGAMHGAGGEDQGHLPVSLDPEGGFAEGAECGAAGDDGARGGSGGAAQEHYGGCRCAEADVRVTGQWPWVIQGRWFDLRSARVRVANFAQDDKSLEGTGCSYAPAFFSILAQVSLSARVRL